MEEEAFCTPFIQGLIVSLSRIMHQAVMKILKSQLESQSSQTKMSYLIKVKGIVSIVLIQSYSFETSQDARKTASSSG